MMCSLIFDDDESLLPCVQTSVRYCLNRVSVGGPVHVAIFFFWELSTDSADCWLLMLLPFKAFLHQTLLILTCSFNRDRFQLDFSFPLLGGGSCSTDILVFHKAGICFIFLAQFSRPGQFQQSEHSV